MACNAIINHDNCDFDTNCGFTCEQVYWREAAKDPDFTFDQNHYNDFMAMCEQFYFPDGCPDGSNGSSSSVAGSSSGSGCSECGCGSDMFWQDFKETLDDPSLHIFFMGLLAFILTLRAVIRIIKSAVR